jgi:hypothetical protein
MLVPVAGLLDDPLFAPVASIGAPWRAVLEGLLLAIGLAFFFMPVIGMLLAPGIGLAIGLPIGWGVPPALIVWALAAAVVAASARTRAAE